MSYRFSASEESRVISMIKTGPRQSRARTISLALALLAALLSSMLFAESAQASVVETSAFLNHTTGNSNFSIWGTSGDWPEGPLTGYMELEFSETAAGPWGNAHTYEKSLSSTTVLGFPRESFSTPPCGGGFYRNHVKVSRGSISSSATSPVHFIPGGGPAVTPAADYCTTGI
jgi:hypothetical protein